MKQKAPKFKILKILKKPSIIIWQHNIIIVLVRIIDYIQGSNFQIIMKKKKE